VMRFIRWWVWQAVALAATVGAQNAAPSPVRLWPSGGPASPIVSAFGNVVHCELLVCDRSASLGVDARVIGQLRFGVDARLPGFDYGMSYAWSRVGFAATVGRGTSVLRGVSRTTTRYTRNVTMRVDSLNNRVIVDTVLVPYAASDSSELGATHWSSTETRLTWRDDRWWATAILGRVAVARQGAALWTGLQLGAELGRGASLLMGAATTPKLIALTEPQPERHTVSLGLGFNTALLAARPPAHATNETSDAAAAFVISRISTTRVRVTLRVPSAQSIAFASDCTGWTSVEMAKTRDGWIVDIDASPGMHRVNIRVNNGRWTAPPALPSINDDFAGEVGIFVVE
jgi:hypothetical protein